METSYYPAWQKNRVEFITEMYGAEFFRGKRVLELGAYNGYIGYRFSQMGASVTCIEGRLNNVDSIKNTFPMLDVLHGDLDTPNWEWGTWDIIINFGLFYHLEKHHDVHMSNCLSNCGLMFFESVIYDSDESEIYFREERGDDQSLTDTGGTPSTSYVENLFTRHNATFMRYDSSKLNGDGHTYDWTDLNCKRLADRNRRFWVVAP